ncbi:light-harvesting protein [Yoonia sp. SS1-5]|uniref:Antenna pigment protein alpha chain n=1 Tax=Yoonia rhodophyticola TaxID=3137370 RepID=A0AAN0MDG5_9RHOB
MNNAKMWLVVNPSVGVPVFLGAVALGSFAVHVAVVSNTSWVSDFLSGVEMGTGDKMAAAQLQLPDMETANASYVTPLENGGLEVTIMLPDGTITKGVLQMPEVHAAAHDSNLAIPITQ